MDRREEKLANKLVFNRRVAKKLGALYNTLKGEVSLLHVDLNPKSKP